jgi:riboflavin kinase/FMN adenylyltransferase
LRDGAPEQAAALMGHAFAIEAEVQQGDQRGRTIGFATANMPLHDYVLPKFGVYAVRAAVLDGAFAEHELTGVANLGLRPTVGTDKPRLESHFFDFKGDLYGATLRVALLHFIRPEQKFDGLDALKAQIAMDSDKAREMLGS